MTRKLLGVLWLVCWGLCISLRWSVLPVAWKHNWVFLLVEVFGWFARKRGFGRGATLH